jgi:hypothetical protein
MLRHVATILLLCLQQVRLKSAEAASGFTARAQMQTVTKMQLQTMDHMMAAWEEQIKSSSESPGAIGLKLREVSSDNLLGMTSLPLTDARIAALRHLKARAVD